MKVCYITDDLRKRITAGEFPPGAMLPMRKELLAHYDVSVAAFQKTINTLIAEGFLESRNSQGVFVASAPPHLCRLALALPICSAAELPQDSLWNALLLAGDTFLFEERNVTLVPYYIGTMLEQGNGLKALQKDAAKNRIAGAVFFRHNPVVELPPAFPKICFEYHPDEHPMTIRMATDHVSLFNMALNELKKQGVKKCAVLFQETLNSHTLVQLRKIAEKSGLFIPEEWMIPLDIRLTNNLAQKWLVSGLFSANLKNHPDGLIIMNGNLLPMVMDRLLDLGMLPGKQIKIVSHCNRPTRLPVYSDVNYIGFHAADILQSFMKGIRNFSPEKISPVEQIQPKIF